MSKSVTVTQRLYIAASPEEVWDFTQSELYRPLWKSYCSDPKVLECRPPRLVRFQGCGLLSGVWTYEPRGPGTVWAQSNTLALEKPLHRVAGPIIRWWLKRLTRRSMRRVKEALEFSEDLSGSLHEDFF
jgi:hypothetical protein